MIESNPNRLDPSREDLNAALGPIVRLALRRGIGLPNVVAWAQRAAGGARVEAAPAVTELLCDLLMRQRNEGSNWGDLRLAMSRL